MAYDFEVKIIGLKGFCRAKHKVGDCIKVSPLNPGNLCGSAFHAIYPMLMALDMDGKLPWDPEGNVIYSACPDLKNQMTMEIHRIPKEENK